MPVYISGTPVRFEVLPTSDPATIAALDRCIANHQGGVSSITKEQYEEAIKKKPTEISSSSVYKQQRQRQELSATQVQGLAVAEAGGVRAGGMFARPQDMGREHRPNNEIGLPAGAHGPAGSGHRIPDPVEVPDRSKIAADRPATAKFGSMSSA